jgi:hypothetical protein
MNVTYYSSLIPLRQLPPQGNWCLPNICVGLRSMFATCTGIRAFTNCDNILPLAVPLPPKTVYRPETKPSIIERRPTVPPRVEESAPPKSNGKKQAVESFMPLATVLSRHPSLAVPSLDLSKVSNISHESAQKFVLATHRVLPSSVFITISSDKPGVSFCMPKGMNKQSNSRHVKLPVPPQKNHPIFTNRRPSGLGQKSLEHLLEVQFKTQKFTHFA